MLVLLVAWHPFTHAYDKCHVCSAPGCSAWPRTSTCTAHLHPSLRLITCSAVNDKTAKDMMGEGFRRQLLMDGQMNNLVFLATQVGQGPGLGPQQEPRDRTSA